MRLLIVACFLAGCFAEMKTGQVVVEYDKYKQLTVVKYSTYISLEKAVIRTMAGMPGGFTLLLIGVAEEPSSASIGLLSSSDSWSFLKCNDLDFLADGVPVPVGETSHDGDVGTLGGSVSVSETVYALLPASSVLQIAQAKTVEGRLCSTEFVLTPEQIALIGEFAKKTGFKASAPPKEPPASTPASAPAEQAPPI